jgi:hypothetical protein
MKRYDGHEAVFKIGRLASMLPPVGQKHLHFSKWQDVLFAASFHFCSTQPLALPEGIFLSEVGKNEDGTNRPRMFT